MRFIFEKTQGCYAQTRQVREEGGIPPLVALLDSVDVKVQRAAAGALRTLAFKCEANKNQIVSCNALPTLIHMLRSEDTAIHYEAVRWFWGGPIFIGHLGTLAAAVCVHGTWL